MNNRSTTIELGRWYRYHKPDGTCIELKSLDGKVFNGRDGQTYGLEAVRELHATEETEALEDDLNWPTGGTAS